MLGGIGNMLVRLTSQAREGKLSKNASFNHDPNSLKRGHNEAIHLKKSSKKERHQKQQNIKLEKEMELFRLGCVLVFVLFLIIIYLV